MRQIVNDSIETTHRRMREMVNGSTETKQRRMREMMNDSIEMTIVEEKGNGE